MLARTRVVSAPRVLSIVTLLRPVTWVVFASVADWHPGRLLVPLAVVGSVGGTPAGDVAGLGRRPWLAVVVLVLEILDQTGQGVGHEL